MGWLAVVREVGERWFDRVLDQLAALGLKVINVLTSNRKQARRALFVSIFGALTLMVAINGVDSVLAEMHPADSPSRNFASLAGLRPGVPDANAAATSVAIWRAWAGDPARDASGFSTPGKVLTYYFLLDGAFILCYVALLAILLATAHARLGEGVDGKRALYQRLAAQAVPLVALLAVADMAENLLSVSAYDTCDAEGCGGSLVYPLAAAALAKYVLVALVLVPLLYAAFAIPTRGPGGDWTAFWRIVSVLRVQVLAVIAFVLALFGPVFAEQGADTIRRWPGPDLSDGVAAIVLTLFFTLLTLALSWRLLERDATARPPGAAGPKRVSLFWLTLGGLALAVFGFVLRDHGVGLLSLGLILVVIGLLSVPVRQCELPERLPGQRRATAIPTLFAVAPLVVLALALVAAATPQLTYTREGQYWLLIVAAVALLITAWFVYERLHDAWSPANVDEPRGTEWAREGGRGWTTFIWSAGVATAVAYAAISLNPWATGATIGAVGLLVIFLAAVSLLGYAVQRFDHHWRPPQVFIALGLTRMPVVVVLVVWAALASRIDDGGYHDVRPLTKEERAGAARQPPTRAQAAWDRWLAAQTRRVADLEEDKRPKAVPLVFVAAEGGGLRAANWAARVLDCGLDGDETSCGYDAGGARGAPESLFALSGASGGSLGLASYVAAVDAGITGKDWVDEHLGLDFVAPLWASLLYVDIPNAFLKLNLLPDRAEVLERSWEQPWDKEATLFDVPPSGGPLAKGLFETYWESNTPLLLLSGTSVLDGCRVNNSVLLGALRPVESNLAASCDSMVPFEQRSGRPPVFTATYDLGRVLCQKNEDDVRLSTAALLSARFPFASPSGRLEICDSDHAIFVVDGGYYDNTGASALVDLWAHVEPLVDVHNADAQRTFCVVPTFLHLDNHVRTPPQADPRRRPAELNAPLTAAGKIRSGHDGDARQAAAAAFQGWFGPVSGATEGGRELLRYAYVFPRAEPGADAPLGWALSESSTTALEDQLAGQNKATFQDVVRRWFSPDLSCEN